MPTLFAAPLVIIAQAVTSAAQPPVYIPLPVPSPVQSVGAKGTDELSQYENYLRRSCYSETAIKLFVEDGMKAHDAEIASRSRQNALLTEVARTAVADPFDLARLEAARAAWRTFQAEREVEQDRRKFDLLRRLPPPDRARYARNFALYSAAAAPPLPTCPAAGQARPIPVAPPRVEVPSRPFDPDRKSRDECLSHAPAPPDEDKCHDRYRQALEGRLAASLRSARAHLAKNERESTVPDKRRDPAVLDRAQKTWDTFVEADCSVQGGLLGGLNSWVSRYERDCVIGALEKRIGYLDSVASGAFEERKTTG